MEYILQLAAKGSSDLRVRAQVFVCVSSGRHGGMSGGTLVGLGACSVVPGQRLAISWWACHCWPSAVVALTLLLGVTVQLQTCTLYNLSNKLY